MALRRNIIANYVGQAWSAAMGLAFIPLYIEYLGMEAYGLIGLFAVMQAWLTLLDMGMTPTLNREMARFTAGAHSPQSIRNLLRSLELIAACIAVLIVLSVWIASGYFASDWIKADKLPTSVVAQAISIMGVVVALRFVESLYRGSLFGLQKQVWYNIVSAGFATLRHGGAIAVLAWISPNVQTFFYWQALISLLSVIVLAVGVRRTLPTSPLHPRFELGAIANVWKFASGVMAVTFLAILLTQLDKVLLSRMLTLELFGYYTLAATVAGVLYMGIAPITSAYYPRLVELLTQKDERAVESLYHQGAQMVTLSIAPAVMLLSIFPREVLFMWSGDITLSEKTAPILAVLALGMFLNGLMHMPAQLQLAYGWVSLSIRANIIAVSVLIPAILWIVPQYGSIGAAWIWVVLNASYVLIAIQFMHTRLLPREKWRWYFADILLPLSGSIVVILLAKLLKPVSYQNRLSDFIFLLIAGVLALVISTMLSDRIRIQLLAYIKYKRPKWC